MNQEFKDELRNVIRFMNSENVKIDEGVIERFCGELHNALTYEREPFKHEKMLDDLDAEIVKALDKIKPTRYIASVNASIKDGVICNNPEFKLLLRRLEAKNMKKTPTWDLCIHIDELMTKLATSRRP